MLQVVSTISQYRQAIGWNRSDLRLCCFFGLSEGFWLRMQSSHALRGAHRQLGESFTSRTRMGDLCRADRLGAMTLALAQPQLEAITAACRKHLVARFHAFGSVLRPDYRPGESDIDLLVEFLPLDASNLYRAYFALLNDLRQGLAARVDLVMADAVRNPIFMQAIDASKQQIYAA